MYLSRLSILVNQVQETPAKLYQLASEGTREAMDRLMQVADDYGVNYDLSTKANELVRKIVWTMNRSEF